MELDKLYVGVDCLLDIEVGLIAQHRTRKQVAKYLKKAKKTVTKHPSVSLGIFTQEQFDECWDKRDGKAFVHSLRTKMDQYIRDIINSCSTPDIGDPQDSAIEIVVDMFPFELGPKDCEYLMTAFVAIFGYDTKITMINEGLGSLDSVGLSKYKWVILRDVETWLTLSIPSLKIKPQRNTNVILPAYTTGVQFEELIADPEMDLMILSQNNPHQLVSSLLGQVVKNDFIDPSYFKAC